MEFKFEEKKEVIIKQAQDIFNVVYPLNCDSENLEYKHYENPYRIEVPILIAYENDKPVGMNAFMGANMKIGKAKFFVIQSCDTAVLPEQRGKGVFTRIINEEEKQEHSEFLYGLPNQNSYSGFMKMGWKEITRFTYMALPMKPFHFFTGMNFDIDKLFQCIINPPQKTYLSENETISKNTKNILTDKDIDLLNMSKKIGFIRTKEYYEWRIDNNPVNQFHYIVLKCEDRLQGFLLYHISSRKKREILMIDDWFINKEETAEKQGSIIRKMLAQFTEQPDVILVPFINQKNGEIAIWKKTGFINIMNWIRKYKGVPLIISENNKKYCNIEECEFRRIDADIIFN